MFWQEAKSILQLSIVEPNTLILINFHFSVVTRIVKLSIRKRGIIKFIRIFNYCSFKILIGATVYWGDEWKQSWYQEPQFAKLRILSIFYLEQQWHWMWHAGRCIWFFKCTIKFEATSEIVGCLLDDFW